MGYPCCLLRSLGHPCIGGCRHVWWVILVDARSQQRLSSIGGCRRSCWIILAVFCARWVILHRDVSPFSMDHPCCLLRSVGHPPSRCVAMLGVDLAEMTGAYSGCPPSMGVATYVLFLICYLMLSTVPTCFIIWSHTGKIFSTI